MTKKITQQAEGMEKAAVELGELDQIRIQGRTDSDAFIAAKAKEIGAESSDRVSRWKKIASFDTKEAANAYVKGWKEAAEAKEESDNEQTKEAARSAKTYVSEYNRIIRAVYGWNKKTDDDKREHFRAQGFGKSDAEGREITLKILSGSGDYRAKLKKMPKTEGGGRPPQDTKGAEQTIVRRFDSSAVGADALAKVMGVGPKVGEKKLSDKERRREAERGVVSAIKAAGDEQVPILARAIAQRMLSTSHKGWQAAGAQLLRECNAIDEAATPQREAAEQ